MTNCPQCGTLMKYLKERVYNNFLNVTESPRSKIYYCDSKLTIYCRGRVS